MSWVDWYNSKATGDQQSAFDRAASVIDNGGKAFQKGGSQENYVENWRSYGPDFYTALVNYRDTGGRRALFSQPEKDYGPIPISQLKQGGPMEQAGVGVVILHPGRYTYTDVTDNGPAFSEWIGATRRAVTLGQTQTSTAATGLGKPYYTDVEFLVSQDTPWPVNMNGHPLMGLPTWLPKSINIVDYWGQVTTSHPDWLAPFRAVEQVGEAAKGLLTLAAIVAIGYVVHELTPSHDRR